MTPSATHSQPRPLLRGLKALAGAQAELPATRKALLAAGPVEYVVAGGGGPAVVVIGGLGVPIQGWALVLPELARVTTVLAHNRLGLGGSAKPRRPQTGAVVVDMLRELLAAAGLAPPHVLVGHAFGGLYANLYARRFPHEVAGLVLLEPTHPDEDFHERRLRFLPRLEWTGSRRGSRRHGEQHFLEQTKLEIEQAGPFPEVPLTVVSGSRTPPRLTTSRDQVRTHAVRQKQLVTLSPLGRHVLAPETGHVPQVTDPEIVVRAVREIAAP